MASYLSIERNTLLIYDPMWESYEFLDLAEKFSERNMFKEKKENHDYWSEGIFTGPGGRDLWFHMVGR